MIKTLLLYDGRMSSAERIADRLCYLIGNARVAEITEAPEDLTPYEGFCFVFNFYGTVTAGRTRSYLTSHAQEIDGKRIIMVGIGFSDLGYTKYVTDSEKAAGISGISGIFIQSESETLRAGYEIGRILHEPVNEMEEHRLMDEIEGFIHSHKMLALATAGQGYVRCTPLEYMYLDRVFYIITEGGNKFRGILENGDVSAAIYDPIDHTGARPVRSLQVLAKAAPVPVGSDEYRIAMAARGLTEQKLDQMPAMLFLLKVVPLRYEFLNTSFTDEGYDAKQLIDTEFRRKTWEAGAAYATKEEARRAAKASDSLKADAAAAKADQDVEDLRIPDVTEEPSETKKPSEEDPDRSEADADAAKIVKEIFTEVDTSAEPEDETESAGDAENSEAENAAAPEPSETDGENTAGDGTVEETPDADAGVVDAKTLPVDEEPEVVDAEEVSDSSEAEDDAEPEPAEDGNQTSESAQEPQTDAAQEPEEEVSGTVEPTTEDESDESFFGTAVEEASSEDPDENVTEESIAFEADVFGPEDESEANESEEPEEVVDSDAVEEPETDESDSVPEEDLAGTEEEPAQSSPVSGDTRPVRHMVRPEDNDSDFLRSPLIDTQHLPQIDMSVLENGGDAAKKAEENASGKMESPENEFAADLEDEAPDEADEDAAAAHPLSGKPKKEKRFGLAELEAMEDEEEAENELDEEAYEQQLAELRRRAGRQESGRHPARKRRASTAPAREKARADEEEPETDEETKRARGSAAQRSARRRPGRSSGRKSGGFLSRLKEFLMIEPEGDDSDEDEEE